MHHPGELTAADRAAWSALQRARPPAEAPQLHNPFLAPEFTLATGACRRDVRIAVVREDGVPAAFFPHQRTPAGVGRAVGLGISDCQGLVHRPGFTGDAGELLRGAGLAVWEFDHLAADQPLFADGAGARFGSPVMDVADGWESYLAGLRERSPKFTRTTLAKERRLDRDLGPLRYVHDERDPEMLRLLMAWKSAQYRRTGRGDRFARPWITRLVEHLFHTGPGEVRGLLSVLCSRRAAGRRPLRAPLGGGAGLLVPGVRPGVREVLPGLVLHLAMARGAAGDGMTLLDLGRGRKEYKDSLKTRELTVAEGWVTRRHPVALGHRMRRAPLRALRNTVQGRPELFRPADALLKRMGRFRTGG